MPTGMHADMLTELQGRKRVFPVAELTFDGTMYGFASEAVASLSQGLYYPYVPASGWGPITRSIGDRRLSLQSADGSLDVYDDRRVLQKLFAGPVANTVVGSAAKIILRSNELAASKHYTLLDGIITDFRPSAERQWHFVLGADERLFDVPNKIKEIMEVDFPNVPEASIGLPGQLVTGEHYSQGISDSKGMVPCICVDPTNYWWYVSEGCLSRHVATYKNGTEETAGVWVMEYKLLNARWYTIVRDTTSTATADDTVTVDVEGIESWGDGVSGSLLENPVDIIENFLANFVFSDYPTGSVDGQRWISRVSVPINIDHNDTTYTFLALRNHKAAKVIAGGQTGRAVLNAWCDSFQCTPFWAWDWKLGLLPMVDLTSKDIYIASRWIRKDKRHALGELGGDTLTDNMFTRIVVNYLLDEARGALVNNRRLVDETSGFIYTDTHNFSYGKSAL